MSLFLNGHCVYKTPWQGDPRVNIQSRRGMARAYQVKQVLLAIGKLEVNHQDITATSLISEQMYISYLHYVQIYVHSL